MIFERRDIRLSTANSQPPPHVETVGLQHLCVDFGDHLRFRKITGPDDDGLHTAGR